MSRTFTIGMVLSATANVGAALAGVGSVGRAVDALSKRALQIRTELQPYRDTEAALAQIDRRIGALNARKLQLTQQLQDAPAQAGQTQAAMEKVGARLDRLNSKRLQLAGDLEKGKTAAAGLETQLGRIESASRRLGESMTAMKARADLRREIQGNILGTVAMGAALAAPVKVAIDFESAMADVRKAADLDPSGVRQMGDAILALSRRVPMAATGLATIMAEAGRAGIARDELLGFAEDTARLAVAFDTTAEEAGSAMVGLRAIFKLNRQQVTELGDAYNELDNNMAATAKGMLEIANRAGNTARLVGMDAVQLGALGASFLELKTPPEIAARAINALLAKLRAASYQSDDVQEGFKRIGLSAAGMEAAMKQDAEGALVMFLKHAKQAENPIGVLTQIVGQGFADDVAKLVDSVDVYEKAIGIVSDKTKLAGSMQREYQNRLDTTANELQLLRNELTRAAVHLGGVFLPGTRLAAKGLGSVLSAADRLGQAMPWLTGAVGGVAASLIGVKIASMGIRYAWTFAADGAAILRQGYILLTTSTRLHTMATTAATWANRGFAASLQMVGAAMARHPVGAVMVGLALAAGLLYANWEKVGPFFTGLWERIGAGATWVRERLDALWRWVAAIDLSTAGGRIIGSLVEGMRAAAMRPVELMREVAGKIRNLLPFSPAKEGPLADLDRVRLFETVADGLNPTPLHQRIGQALSGASRAITGAMLPPLQVNAAGAPGLSLPSPAMPGGPAFGGGGMAVNVTNYITVHGAEGEPKALAQRIARETGLETDRVLRRKYAI